jgi:hypothetical protein
MQLYDAVALDDKRHAQANRFGAFPFQLYKHVVDVDVGVDFSYVMFFTYYLNVGQIGEIVKLFSNVGPAES